MEVLNLATKEKQDEILSNFPISGGTDFIEGVPLFARHTASGDTYTEVMSVEGRGVLTGIMQRTNNSSGKGYVKVFADGVEIYLGYFTDGLEVSSISPFIGFKHSLQVLHSSLTTNFSVTTYVVCQIH